MSARSSDGHDGSSETELQREGSFRSEDRQAEAPGSLPEAPSCPFCDGDETELMSAFGSHASVSTYWCRACRSPFELMKWR